MQESIIEFVTKIVDTPIADVAQNPIFAIVMGVILSYVVGLRYTRKMIRYSMTENRKYYPYPEKHLTTGDKGFIFSLYMISPAWAFGAVVGELLINLFIRIGSASCLFVEKVLTPKDLRK